MRAETEARIAALDDMIVQVQAEQAEQAGKGPGCSDIGLAGLTLRRGVAMPQQDDPTRGGEHARDDMGKINRQ